MLKFLRKIRQKSINENKTINYLKYAIGEIVLVVIGILIALQINNWNEKKKNHNLVNIYQQGLIENLSSDSLNISRMIDNVKRDLEKTHEFELRVSKSSKPFDTILKIARYEYNFRIAVNYNYENDTYLILNSTGHLSLFNNDLIRELSELYNLQKKALFAMEKTYDNYSRVAILYSQKYPFCFESNLIQNGTVAASEVWNNISLANHATEFNSLIINKSDCYRLELEVLPLILEKTNKLLRKLRKKT
ncbi:hypothetical protein GCM10007962_29050 [Yeosuana aromativorans]|uniref:Uncharacterized protein n=1 Tax=Yeosuana aromativorans TaxID=288019 RepID=A0A8J3BMS9_9FLAO|nr:DUF6090 family protein [Yeosuana aromativorans]GGK32938.1 hypothetical protein GCM10007962_29050 [Yeosuana aromativorans]